MRSETEWTDPRNETEKMHDLMAYGTHWCKTPLKVETIVNDTMTSMNLICPRHPEEEL